MEHYIDVGSIISDVIERFAEDNRETDQKTESKERIMMIEKLFEELHLLATNVEKEKLTKTATNEEDGKSDQKNEEGDQKDEEIDQIEPDCEDAETEQ